MNTIDTNVQPHFRYNAEIRRYLSAPHKLRSIPDVEQQWYQAPGGDYRQDLYGEHYPVGSAKPLPGNCSTMPGSITRSLNPLTRGNIADYLLNSRICAAVNDWLVDRWLEPDTADRFRGTIRVNPEDRGVRSPRSSGLPAHPKMVQVGVPMQSREPYGKPMFEPIWEAAAAHRAAGRRAHQRRQRRRLSADIRRPRAHLSWLCGVHAAELLRPPGDAHHRGHLRPASGSEVRLRRRRLRHPDPADVAAGHVLAVDA